MRHQLWARAVMVSALILGSGAQAGTVSGSFSGAGISGSGTLTVGPDPVAGDPVGALAITGITGTFTDANIGLFSLQITGIIPTNPAPPQGPPFPNSLSFFAATGLPSPDTSVSYDNLYYPDGSPIVCNGYPGHGGVFDIYGVLFQLNNGDVVDLWSNGTFMGGPPLSYGVAVLAPTTDPSGYAAVDYVGGGITEVVPEPGSLGLLASGLLGVLAYGLKFRAVRAKARDSLATRA